MGIEGWFVPSLTPPLFSLPTSPTTQHIIIQHFLDSSSLCLWCVYLGWLWWVVVGWFLVPPPHSSLPRTSLPRPTNPPSSPPLNHSSPYHNHQSSVNYRQMVPHGRLCGVSKEWFGVGYKDSLPTPQTHHTTPLPRTHGRCLLVG